jgi:chromosome segregation ATPase
VKGATIVKKPWTITDALNEQTRLREVAAKATEAKRTVELKIAELEAKLQALEKKRSALWTKQGEAIQKASQALDQCQDCRTSLREDGKPLRPDRDLPRAPERVQEASPEEATGGIEGVLEGLNHEALEKLLGSE